MDWLDLLAIQGTLKSVLQHYSLKASILQHSAFFTVQLSHPYTTTGKTIALTRRTFVRKVVSVFFNMLSRFVIAFPPMRKMVFFVVVVVVVVCLFVLWLQLPSVVILEPKKIKSTSNSFMNFQGPIRPGTHHLSDFILSPFLTPTSGSDPLYATWSHAPTHGFGPLHFHFVFPQCPSLWSSYTCLFIVIHTLKCHFFRDAQSSAPLCVKMTGNVLLTVSYITAHGVLQERILEWVAISFSSGSCYIRTLCHVPFILAGSAQHGS